jgi:methylthioribose-1-phosphate isomerase
VCGAYGVVLGLDQAAPSSAGAAHAALERAAERIGVARPTAANLRWATRRVARAGLTGATPAEVRHLAVHEAKATEAEDRDSCRLIAEIGRSELSGHSRILTHCNTGRLATAGIGTALGVVYAKAELGQPVEVLACETRPLLQGARLTAWELQEAGIPVTLLADAAAGASMATGSVDAAIVGCDRVARNGDTANKIGTYSLAVLARANGIPFYVAGPMSSFDPDARTGRELVIEQRPAGEVLNFAGARVAPQVDVFNPAFDVTPAELISGFITDVGVLKPPYDRSIPRALRERVASQRVPER